MADAKKDPDRLRPFKRINNENFKSIDNLFVKCFFFKFKWSIYNTIK